MFLFDAVCLEQVCWKAVYQVAEPIPGLGMAYYNPAMPHIPHWNIFYPNDPERVLTSDEIKTLEAFYRSLGIEGHLLDFNHQSKEKAVSRDEYLFQPTKPEKFNVKVPADFEVKQTLSLDEFVPVVRDVFAMNEVALKDVHRQLLQAEQAGLKPRHFLAYCGSKVCGSFSLFQVSKDYDFRMNLGLLPEFRGKGLSYCLSALASLSTPLKIITHTTSDALKTKALPKTGFQSLGEVNIVPFKSLVGAP